MMAVQKSDVAAWIEVWDYVGGNTFRGFLTTKPQRSLIMFFDSTTLGPDLKSGLMALIELAGADGLQCEQLLVCIERDMAAAESRSLMRDLGWVGFEAATLATFSGVADNLISPRWLFMELDL